MKLPKRIYLLNLNGNGDSDGNGYGYGNGNGSGSGNGNGYGNGSGSGNGYGNDYRSGHGNGNGNGNGSGNGNGYGNGYRSGHGNGNVYSHGIGVYLIKLWNEWFEISGELENSLCKNIPAHLHNKINKDFLLKVNNLECLRILRDKIGLEKYISLFDAEMINREMDNQGNEMKLYKYDEKGNTVILLEVVCPSTQRIYHLYPPNQRAKTCFEAKASTFGKSVDIFKTKFSES